MRSRADGRDDLLRFRGREDETNVGRRFLDEFEEGVEALRRDHVGFVENEDFKSIASWGEGRALSQVSRVVHTVVRRGVDLDNVDRAWPSPAQFDA
jgi:hypothetical protein